MNLSDDGLNYPPDPSGEAWTLAIQMIRWAASQRPVFSISSGMHPNNFLHVGHIERADHGRKKDLTTKADKPK